MKRYTLYAFSALALLLAAAACTQDDAVLLPEVPEGIPMTFTAKGLNPTAATTTGTRATVDGDWEGGCHPDRQRSEGIPRDPFYRQPCRHPQQR